MDLQKKLSFELQKLAPRSSSVQSSASTSVPIVPSCSHFSSGSSTIYCPLDDLDEIRLLYLQPRFSDHDDTIRCNIKHVKLSEAPNYEALSYMWGFKGNEKPIYVDANDHYVRENLWSALYHLRLKDEERPLWIDAICINQDNIAERNLQVSQMGRIYSNASRAVVWLGGKSVESSLAIGVLSKTGNDSDWASFSDNSILFPPVTEKGILKLEAIRSICYREYWTRLWIIQEVLSATDILICCENESLPWANLSAFFALLTQPLSSGLGPTGLAHDFECIITSINKSIPSRLFRDASKLRHLQSWNEPPNRTLFGLCVEYGEAKCEDRRDKIFGLHAFARDCCQQAAPVDYSLSWYEIYSMVLLHYVLQHTNRKVIGGDISFAQEFHQRLDFTSKEPLSSMPSRLRLEDLAHTYMKIKLDPMPIKFWGNARGRVKLTVPLSNRVSELPEITKLSPFMQLYISQLHFIENLHPYLPDRKNRVTSQVDLVWSANARVSRITCPVKPSFPNYLGRTDPRTGSKSQLPLQKHDTAALEDNFRSILDDAHEAIRGTAFADCVLAFEENGLVCFAPRETKVGDLICQFLSSDVLAIVRPTWRGYGLVGRGVSFLASDPKIPFQALPIRSYLSKDFDVKLCEVLFEMDIFGLQMMSRASALSCRISETMTSNT